VQTAPARKCSFWSGALGATAGHDRTGRTAGWLLLLLMLLLLLLLLLVVVM
jgi:hypothetical protein